MHPRPSLHLDYRFPSTLVTGNYNQTFLWSSSLPWVCLPRLLGLQNSQTESPWAASPALLAQGPGLHRNAALRDWPWCAERLCDCAPVPWHLQLPSRRGAALLLIVGWSWSSESLRSSLPAWSPHGGLHSLPQATLVGASAGGQIKTLCNQNCVHSLQWHVVFLVFKL